MKKTIIVAAFSLLVLGLSPARAFACSVNEDCDDDNPCTIDTCEQSICVNDFSTTNGTTCDDLDECTMDDTCLDGQCGGDPMDEDQDTYVSDLCGGSDCDDSDPDVHPDAEEGPDGDLTCEDLADNDCDGASDLEDPGCVPCVDNDQDGFGAEASENCPYPLQDCDDINPEVNPGVVEGPPATPTCADGRDNDCDGLTDKDDEFCFGSVLWTPGTAAEASMTVTRSATGAGWKNLTAALLLPVGVILCLKAVRRRK